MPRVYEKLSSDRYSPDRLPVPFLLRLEPCNSGGMHRHIWPSDPGIGRHVDHRYGNTGAQLTDGELALRYFQWVELVKGRDDPGKIISRTFRTRTELEG